MAAMRTTVLTLLLLAAGAPAAADWLVTRDGSRLETRGPWQVKGKMVVFTAANGTLSSLRLSEVDLEASRVATETAKAPPPEPEPPPKAKEPVLVLTDADIPRARKPPPQPEAEEEAEEQAGTVHVASWSEISEPGSFDVQILGTLRNDTPDLATDLAVTVKLFGDGGALLGEQPARLQTQSLAPGATANFRALFPGLVSFSTVTFEVQGNSMRLQAPAPAGEEA